MTAQAKKIETHLQLELGRVVFGAQTLIHALTIAIIARGHILLEGPPGLGKTLLSKSFAKVLGGVFKRIQGTADLMPTDMTGVHVFNSKSGNFEFKQGPLFADVVLVDEINRAGPKTQSALLEAMEERQLTVDRESFSLADDFLIIATQNPNEFEGTFPLPESQLDRFTLCVPMHYPAKEDEAQVIEKYNLPDAQHAADSAECNPLAADVLRQARSDLDQVHLSSELVNYILDLATATRDSKSLSLGLSTRGALTLARCARIEASLRGGEYVIPDDVKRVAPWVIVHRLMLAPEAAIDGVSVKQVVDRILAKVEVQH